MFSTAPLFGGNCDLSDKKTCPPALLLASLSLRYNASLCVMAGLTLDTISSGRSKSLEVCLRGELLTNGLSVLTEYWQSDGDLLTKGLSVSTEYWQSEGVGEDVKGG